jgi:hypothetical protein
VLIRVRALALSRLDLLWREGSYCEEPQFPAQIGRIQNQQSRPGSLCLLPDICGGGARKNRKGHISTINIS